MTLFFAAAFLTLAIAALGIEGRTARRRRQLASAARRRGGPTTRRSVADWLSLAAGWRAAMAGAVVALVSAAIIIDALDPLTSLSWATWVLGPATTQVMAGCLAGTALAWGLARIHTVTALTWTGLAEVGATLVVPIAVFVVAAMHADLRPNGSLRSLEIGGLAKVELAAAPVVVASPSPKSSASPYPTQAAPLPAKCRGPI